MEVEQEIIKDPDGFRPLYAEPPVLRESPLGAAMFDLERHLRYEHLPEEEQHVIDAILKGYHPIETLPRQKSRVVRIFISSTFTDMEQERNTLIQRAYPKMKAYCREKHGLEFQVVDMRWGVPSQARDDHSTNDLCMEEIRNAQKHSVGPNFVAFLGQKYGYVNNPSAIDFEVYEPVRGAIRELLGDVTLDFLDTWYRKDSNCARTQYVLQPISSVLGEDVSGWPTAEGRLMEILVAGAKQCAQENELVQGFLEKLTASITEQEISEGALNLGRQAQRDDNVLCFTRDIVDLRKHLDRSKVRAFIDLIPDRNEVDEEKNSKMAALRNRKLVPQLAAGNSFHYEINWHDPTGVDKVAHETYLDRVATTFVNRITAQIDSNVARQERQTRDSVHEEVLNHWQLVQARCADFMGQDKPLQAIEDYILADTDQPFIIHAQSGYGKTSLMAKAASEVPSNLRKKGLAVLPAVLIRFCGTSSASSNIRQLLHSLCHQLAFCTGKFRHQLPTDFKLIKSWFIDFLKAGDFPGMVVIFLDALNQLSGTDSAHKLDWLPSKIARNVKIIVSTVPDECGILKKLHSKITNPRYSFEIPAMTPTLCGEILSKSLTNNNRIINFLQWRAVKDALAKCSSPLFMKLTFEEALRWRSYTQIEIGSLATSVTACIHRLFDRLEEKHGGVMVQRALGYITATQAGISESELEDVMSVDDALLNAIFVFWEPPVRRVPPILFPRIHNDIAGYLTEREVDETSVLYWYHQQFITAARERYLCDPALTRDLHSNLSDYFLGTWSRMRKKPFRYEESLAERLRITERESAAVRFVPEQPLKYMRDFNFRKLNQLPYHLANADRLPDLFDEVYFNYTWLETKLRACSPQRVIQDYNLQSHREVAMVADALRMSEAALGEDPTVLSVELTGRLLPHYASQPNVRKLILQCDRAALMKCPLVPNWQVYTSPGGPLQYVLEAGSITSGLDCCLVQSEDTVLLAAKPLHSERMRVWDVTQGQPQPDMSLISGSQVYPTPDGTYINLFKNRNFMQTYRVDSGELYGEVKFDHGNIRQVVVSNRYVAFTLEQSVGPVVIDFQAKMLVNKFQFQATSVAVSQDDSFLVTNNGRCLAVFSLPIVERKYIVEVANAPEKLLFCKDPSKFYVMDSGHELSAVNVNLALRKATPSGVMRDLEMKDFVLSHSEKYMLVRSSRCLYIFHTRKDSLQHRIVNMPPGVFLERLSTFKDGGFTPNDEYIIAARHIYLGVWCVRTGKPVRLMQTSIAPIMKLFTSDILNRAITLLNDHSIQVWNLDNIDADVQHLNPLLRGTVKHLSCARTGHRVIACGAVHAEARVLDTHTNACLHTLEHTEEVGRVLDGVVISPCGSYAVTRFENNDNPDELRPWTLLKEDKLWDLSDGQCILSLASSRFVVFSPCDDKVVFFQCRHYSTYDWSRTAYDLVIYLTQGELKGESYCLGLPEGDVVGEPLITASGRYLCMIMQLKNKVSIGTKSGNITQQSKRKQGDKRAIVLVVYSFETVWRGLKFVELSDIWNCFGDDDQMMDVSLYHENTVLVIYGRRCGFFSHDENGVLDRSRLTSKAGFQYDIHRDSMVKRYDSLLASNSPVNQLMHSQACSCIMDKSGQVFSTIDNELVNIIKNVNSLASFVFVLDGKYVVRLAENKREIHVERTCDGVRKARVFVHGTAVHIQNVSNDRSVAISCKDGRVMIYSVILESPDPVREIISLMPSRIGQDSTVSTPVTAEVQQNSGTSLNEQTSPMNGVNNDVTTHLGTLKRLAIANMKLLKTDIENIKTTQNMQQRLSTITRAEIADRKRKNATFKAVGQAVALTQELKKVNNSSAACVIQ